MVIAENDVFDLDDIDGLTEEQKAQVVSLVARKLWELEEGTTGRLDFAGKSYDPATIVKLDGAYRVHSYVYSPQGRSFVAPTLNDALNHFLAAVLMNLTKLPWCAAKAMALTLFPTPTLFTDDEIALAKKSGMWTGEKYDALAKQLCAGKREQPFATYKVDGAIDITNLLMEIAEYYTVDEIGRAFVYVRMANELAQDGRALVDKSGKEPWLSVPTNPLYFKNGYLVVPRGYKARIVEDERHYGRVVLERAK